MADPLQEHLDSQAAQQTPAAATPPPSTPAPAAQAPASSPPSQPSSAVPSAQGWQPSFLGVREALASGYNLDLRQQFPDDHAALAALANGYRQAQALTPVMRQYQQHQQEFQQYLAAKQQEAQQRQAQQAPSWWKAPEFDPKWRNQIVRDPQTGKLMPADGADPFVVQKYTAAMEHTQQFLDKFAFDPIGAIRPGIEEVVKETAQQMMQQQLGGYQEQQFAQGWVAQNSGWLHARDQQGNIVPDPHTGRPALSALGQRFAGYVQQAESYGIQNVQAQQSYALRMTQNDYLMSQRQQPADPNAAAQQPVQPGDAAKQNFLQQAAQRQPNYGQAAAQNQPPPKTPQDLQRAMLAEMAANGYGPGTELPMGPPR